MSGAAEAVARRRAEWVELVNGRNAEGYADLLTEDVVWLPPVGEPIEGREAFRAWLAPFFRSWEYEFTAEPTRVHPFDGWCAELGRFLSRLTPADGGETREHGGEYFILWRLDRDGTWRIERYVDVTREGSSG